MKSFNEWMNEQNTIPFSKLGINKVYHKGSVSSPEQIDPFRLAIKQNKKGRSYGGFYVGDLKHAQMYPGENLLEISINPNAKVLLAGMVDRMQISDLKNYANQGIDMIWGNDIRGEKQGLVLNKNAILSIKNINAESMESSL
jgi:hypothetical protein